MTPEIVFYDGACGLCHLSVRFVVKHDHENRFRFAPLGGPTFLARVPEPDRAALPDSLVLMRHDGGLLLRSDGALHVLRQLGGAWYLLGQLGRVVPRPLRDLVYDCVARVRHRLFSRPKEICPVVPAGSRGRFLP